MGVTEPVDLNEYPAEYRGRKAYVRVRSLGKIVAACYVQHTGSEYELLPEYGGPTFASKRVGSVQVMKDMGEYTSPVDGAHIGSRSAHREHIRRHDLVEVGNERIGSMERPQDSGHRAGRDIQQALQRARAG